MRKVEVEVDLLITLLQIHIIPNQRPASDFQGPNIVN